MSEKAYLSRRLVLAVCANILALGLYLLFAWGISEGVDRYKLALAEKTRAERREQGLLNLKKELELLSDERRQIDALFVPKSRVSAFVEEIESTAFAAGAAVSINTLRIEPAGGTDALYVDYTVKGSLGMITDQLSRLDLLPYIIDVRSVDISKDLEEKTLWNARVTLALRSYLQ